ncbi:TIGR04255 family protein [Pseudomonas sp. NPDC099000]|uniref:TIGR04255 family protein n=1 Tax=Pseudomonas sp. NPDC099000 TaxID=3364488 RepID=UPI00383A50F0
MDHITPMLQTNSNAVSRNLPHGLTHEVERLMLGFDWKVPLDGATMAKLAAAGEQIADALPRKFEISTSQAHASLGTMSGLSSSDDSELYAVLFDDNEDKTAPFDEKYAEVMVNTDGFYFSVYHKYDGWEKTRALALKLYTVFYEAVLKDIQIGSIEFRVSNFFGLDEFTGSLVDLLNEDCDSLPPRVFAADGLWHIDEGYYEPQGDLDGRYLLVNLNVSQVQEENRRQLRVRTMHQYDFDMETPESQTLESIFDRFETLHSINKRLLATVLNPEISLALGLLNEGVTT